MDICSQHPPRPGKGEVSEAPGTQDKQICPCWGCRCRTGGNESSLSVSLIALLESGFVAVMGSQQHPVASCDTWFLRGFHPLCGTFTHHLSQGYASRVRCRERAESQQGWIVAPRALSPRQGDAPQEERVCHDFKPISARALSKRSALVPVTWWQQHRHCDTRPARWAEKHRTSPCPCPRVQLYHLQNQHGCTRCSVQAPPRRKGGLGRSPRAVCEGKGWQRRGADGSVRHARLSQMRLVEDHATVARQELPCLVLTRPTLGGSCLAEPQVSQCVCERAMPRYGCAYQAFPPTPRQLFGR